MGKIKKLKRKKKFRVNINRKRLRNKLRKLPNIECKQIKEAWSLKQSTISNLTQMGLAIDPNKVLKVPDIKRNMFKVTKNSDKNVDVETVKKRKSKKLQIARTLEEEAKYPRARLFRLPQNEVQFVTYMIDKYGEDYKAMVRDRKNYNQFTWHQIKRKVDKFKSIPEQYAEYLVKKGEIILDDPTPLKKIKPSVQEPINIKTNSKRSKRKKKKLSLIESIWQEETIDNNELIKDNTDLEKYNIINNETSSENKLQLFSDNENESNDNDVSSSEDENSVNVE